MFPFDRKVGKGIWKKIPLLFTELLKVFVLWACPLAYFYSRHLFEELTEGKLVSGLERGDSTGPIKVSKGYHPEPGEAGHAVASLANAKNTASLEVPGSPIGVRHRCHRSDYCGDWESLRPLGSVQNSAVFMLSVIARVSCL